MKKRSHELKATPESFRGVTQGTNLAQVRLNDRDFQAGDELYLREFLPDVRYYTSACSRVDVTEVLQNIPGIVPGYCVLSVKLRLGQIRERGPGGYEEKKDVDGPSQPVQKTGPIHLCGDVDCGNPNCTNISEPPEVSGGRDSDSASGVGIGDLERDGTGSHTPVSGSTGRVGGPDKRGRKNSGGSKQVQKHPRVSNRVRNRKGARKAKA